MEDYKPIIFKYCQNKDLNPTESEARFMIELVEICPDERLTFERRSDSYISAVCGLNDFLRFKITERTKWFSINLPPELRKKYKDSPLFASQENKNLVQWKVNFTSFNELEPYKELFAKSCIYME